jgi:hypothetical protein
MNRTIYLLVKIDGDCVSYGEVGDNEAARALNVVAGLMVQVSRHDAPRLLEEYVRISQNEQQEVNP